MDGKDVKEIFPDLQNIKRQKRSQTVTVSTGITIKLCVYYRNIVTVIVDGIKLIRH